MSDEQFEALMEVLIAEPEPSRRRRIIDAIFAQGIEARRVETNVDSAPSEGREPGPAQRDAP
jgi:hypothetical protein